MSPNGRWDDRAEAPSTARCTSQGDSLDRGHSTRTDMAGETECPCLGMCLKSTSLWAWGGPLLSVTSLFLEKLALSLLPWQNRTNRTQTRQRAPFRIFPLRYKKFVHSADHYQKKTLPDTFPLLACQILHNIYRPTKRHIYIYIHTYQWYIYVYGSLYTHIYVCTYMHTHTHLYYSPEQ